MFDWNDLRYLLAVAEHGSTLAASRALQVNQSTVQRRLLELERGIGQPLVRRHPTGYRLTEFGMRLLPHARQVADKVQELQQHVLDARRDIAGVVRVTCPEPMVRRITQSELLASFRARYPAVQVEFVMSDKYLDLARGEADIALRSGDTVDEALVGRKIADSVWAVYASRRYVEQHGQPRSFDELAGHALVGFDESMADHRASRWLREVAPQGRVVARNNSVLGLIYSVKSGMGLAPLPAALGDAEPELVRVLGPVPELARSWRILAPIDLRKTPRVAAFFDYMVEHAPQLRALLMS